MKITDDVYALDSTKGNYAYLILREKNVLVDTGRPGQGKSILDEIKSMNINPEDIKKILITHHDVDHIGNAALLQQATEAILWASKEDKPYINGDVNRPGIKGLLSFFMRVKKPDIMESRELCNEIRRFTWDFEFRTNETVSATPQDKDKAKSLMETATTQIQKASLFT